jgi:glucokinase
MAKEAKTYVAAVDMGGTKTLAAIVDRDGKIHNRVKARTPVKRGPEPAIETIAHCVEQAMHSSGIPRARIACVGLGLPGPIDPEAGVVKVAPNLGWVNVPVKKLLEKRLKMPVYLENDANAGTLGEARFGAGIGKEYVVGIFIGTGIGGGLICGGELYHGFGKVAGEVGHMILKTNGPKCGCGNNGCWEALASRLAIVRDLTQAINRGAKTVLTKMMSRKKLQRIRSSLLADAFHQGDKLTVKVIRRSALYSGAGVASLLNLLNPEMIILGGGVVEALGAQYVDLVAKAAKKQTFAVTFQGVKIVPAKLKDDAVLLGAACVAMDHV